MDLIIIAIVAYLVLLQTFEISHQYKNTVRKIEYNGLIWVILDYYTIIKYNSPDRPISWIKFIKIVI